MSEFKLKPCPFCGGKAHIRRRIRYRSTGNKGIVYDFSPGGCWLPDGEVESEVDLLDWSFGYQVWCGRCKVKTPYVFGPWHGYTKDELEELDRDDFHDHKPDASDVVTLAAAVEAWNRRDCDEH